MRRRIEAQNMPDTFDLDELRIRRPSTASIASAEQQAKSIWQDPFGRRSQRLTGQTGRRLPTSGRSRVAPAATIRGFDGTDAVRSVCRFRPVRRHPQLRISASGDPTDSFRVINFGRWRRVDARTCFGEFRSTPFTIQTSICRTAPTSAASMFRQWTDPTVPASLWCR